MSDIFVTDPVRTNYVALLAPDSHPVGLLRLVWGRGQLDMQYLNADGEWISDGSVIDDLQEPYSRPISPAEAHDVATMLGGNLVYGHPYQVDETLPVEHRPDVLAVRGGDKKAVGSPVEFNEKLHPRYPKGHPKAGQFMDKPDAIRFLSRLTHSGRASTAQSTYLQELEQGKVDVPKPSRGHHAEQHAELFHPDPARLGSLEDLARLGVPQEIIQQIQDRGLDEDLTSRKKGETAQQILGDFSDTKQLHTDPGTGAYSAERAKLHDKIIDLFLREKKPIFNGKFIEWVPDENGGYVQAPGRKLRTAVRKKAEIARRDADNAPDDVALQKIAEAWEQKLEGLVDHKRALFLAGGNASGKSTALYSKDNDHLMKPDSTTVEINFDLIKERMPEFQALAGAHDIYGTDATHFESADIANRLVHEAQSRGLNMIVDASGNSSKPAFLNQIRKAKADGYETHVLMVDAPIDVAMRDSVARGLKTGRYIPSPVLMRVHQNAVRNHMSWRNDPAVDSWQLYRRYESGGGEGGTTSPSGAWESVTAKVAEGGKGKTKVLDRNHYEAVLSKASGGLGYNETELGATPFRPEDSSDGFYQSEKAQEFEKALVDLSQKYNVKVAQKKQATGLWKGQQEPSYALVARNGEDGVRQFASELGRQFKQDSVMTFRQQDDGPHYLYQFDGVNTERAIAALDKVGLPGGRIVGTILQIAGDDSIAEKVANLFKELSVEPRIVPGIVEWVGEEGNAT